MAVRGVAQVLYGVDDLDRCTTFYRDFGLTEVDGEENEVRFQLAEGSLVRLFERSDGRLPPSICTSQGVREVVWGVDDRAELDALASDLANDRDVVQGRDGTVRFKDDQGLPMALSVFARTKPEQLLDRVNAPGRMDRLNELRTWYERATPKLIHHVVFGVPDIDRGMRFYVDRLKFRITDVSRERGIFARCNGRHDHHNLFLLKSAEPFFAHISFGVENIDELLAGANHMTRQGWTSKLGLGRHRISSTLFYYLDAPCGGETEYSTDMDYLDDNWRPRAWEPRFGNLHWVAELPPQLQSMPAPDVAFLDEVTPSGAQ